MGQGYRMLLQGGRVIDGTGSDAFEANVWIEDDRVLRVERGEHGRGSAHDLDFARTIDCKGLIIAPGFIDVHSHSDLQVLEGRTEKVLQGVTSEVVGNCGFSAYPLPADAKELRSFANGIFCGGDSWGWPAARDYLRSVEEAPVTHVESLVGHGSLRIQVAGSTCRSLTETELSRMTKELDESLTAGAAGLSSGLMYAPGSGASVDELARLCTVVASRGKVYATHMRSYATDLVNAVEEQIEIARRSGCRLQISHLQAVSEECWPLQQRALERIEEAVVQGIDVAFDSYPWTAGSTVLTQLLPQWALDGGVDGMLPRLADHTTRAEICREVQREHGRRWEEISISSAKRNSAAIVGQTIRSMAETRGRTPSETVLDILIEQEGEANILQHNQSLDNLRQLLTHPLCAVVSDGFYTKGRPHPRLYGTFPMLLGTMVRERRWMSLPEAIHKITLKAAERFHLKDRGVLRAGAFADITLFDAEVIHTPATYETPALPPVGILLVMLNGRVLVDRMSDWHCPQ